MDRAIRKLSQTVVRPRRLLANLGEGACERSARLRLPHFERRSKSLILNDDGPDLVRVGHGEDKVELVPAEGLHLVDGGRRLRLHDVRLADPAEALPEQGLDRLDPGAVIGY